jgi:ethanolamine permease
VWGVVLFVGVMTVYYLLYSRKRLVAQAPEEENALLALAMGEIEQADTLAK